MCLITAACQAFLVPDFDLSIPAQPPQLDQPEPHGMRRFSMTASVAATVEILWPKMVVGP